MKDSILEKASELLRPVPDFPKPGILFWDIAPVLRESAVLKHLVDLLAKRWENEDIGVVAGFDARGFIFGPMLAQKLGVAFEQIRKVGKLPGKTKSIEYELEYGSAVQEVIDDGFINGKNVLMVDDLLATGGTALCGAKLIEELGGTVVGLSVITELPALGGRGLMSDYRTHSLITAVGERKLTDAAYCVDMVAQDKHTGEMILIERLNHPTGIATPGGHIEDESPIAAAVREMIEETGCPVLEIKYHSTLADPDRDPRGPKLSLVMSCLVDSSTTIDEPGKTKVTRVPAFEHLPNDDAFSLGHGPSVRKIWGDRLEVS